MKSSLAILGRLLVLLIFLAAAWLLYERLKGYTYGQIRNAVTTISLWHIVAASLLTVLNYIILVGYDWLAVRMVGETKLSWKKIALASFAGYAFSYNFGATLFGTSIRYRLYSAWGVPLLRIVDLLLILGLTFWFGVFTLAGVVFVATPFRVPKSLEYLGLPFTDSFWVGVILLVVATGYVGLTALRREPLRLWDWKMPIPPLKLTIYQIVIACGDLLIAAGVLYVLLPPVEGGYLKVLGIFLFAFVVAILTHVPGGYGVFDGLVIHFLPEDQIPAVVAGLLVFRLIYDWIPVIIAAVLLGLHEIKIANGATEQGDSAVPASKETGN